jgi:hypothetical protein
MLDELVTPGGYFESPWLSPDHLSIYFASHATTDAVAFATRANADDRFGAPMARADLALQNGDNPRRVVLSLDELEIWIFADGGPMYYSSRTRASDPFPLPTQIDSGPGSASLTADALVAFYTRGDGPIRVATRTSRTQTFDFGGFVGVPGFPDSEHVDSCTTDPTGATLYCAMFSMTDPNHTLRIWQATSDMPSYTTQASYTLALYTQIAPQPSADDYDPMIDTDGHTLVFASKRSPAPADAIANPWVYCD